ncbi:MAG: hypothetical protein F4W90_09445 [Gammaproteobacteria bacterium]|nr:hypothetical protein [Gammaproteobacteria bacterium]
MTVTCCSSSYVAANWYLGISIGGNQSSDVTIESRSNDRASICDEFINPNALNLPNCTTAERGAGDGWLANFKPGSGHAMEAEVGVYLNSRIRIAAVYAHDATNFDQTVSSSDASGADFDKISNELAIGEESLGAVRADRFQISVIRDWSNSSSWTPYLGIGLAATRLRKDFSWLWARNPEPAEITTGIDQPNAAEIQRNLAGTVSAGRRILEDTTYGYAILAGLNRQLTDHVSLGLKLQWLDRGSFKSGPYDGDILRSHPPHLRLDGSEPVHAWSNTDDTEVLNVLVSMQYRLSN